jgi:hypothetical protein
MSNDGETAMKKLVIALGLATLLAAPALAQSYNPSAGSGNLVASPSAAYSGPVGPSARADAAAKPKTANSGASAFAFAPLGAEQPMTTGSVRTRHQRHSR